MAEATWKNNLKEDMRRIRTIKETESHDRDSCNCEGCKWYNVFGTIINHGVIYHVEKDWNNISPEEWNVSFMRFTKCRDDKKITFEKIKKSLIEKGVPADKVDAIVDKIMMDMVPHVVFAELSPQGIMREI